MADWDFLIESTNETLVLDGKTVNEVVTVTSIDESLNVPVTDAGSYAARTFSIDKFSKGLGIVYQQYIMWEYQPNQGGTPYKTGFGIKRSMIDHIYFAHTHFLFFQVFFITQNHGISFGVD